MDDIIINLFISGYVYDIFWNEVFYVFNLVVCISVVGFMIVYYG